MDLTRVPFRRKGQNRVPLHEVLDLELRVGIMHFEKPLVVDGAIDYTSGELVLHAAVAGVKRFECSRCLESIRKPFEQDVILHFKEERENEVNVLPELTGELMSEHPIRILCREDCRGLCPSCGADRNRARCDCV